MPVGPGALSCGEAADPIRCELSARAAGEAAVRERFERAKAECDLPAGSEPAHLARYLLTVTQGMAVQAAGGAGRDELRRVAAMAMRAWPEFEVQGLSPSLAPFDVSFRSPVGARHHGVQPFGCISLRSAGPLLL